MKCGSLFPIGACIVLAFSGSSVRAQAPNHESFTGRHELTVGPWLERAA